jgi:glycosyltransferase involved in cell wall biosynthesis
MDESAISTPTRVLHVITRLIVGGAQENTMFSAALLDKQRYRVEVVCGPQTGSEGSLIEETRQRGVPLTILPELVRQLNPVYDLIALWKLFKLFRDGKYTIVHSHSSKAGILARLAARLAGVPIIVHTVHGWSFHDHMSPGLRYIYIFLEKLTARFSDALIVVAKPDIQKGLKNGIGKPEQYRLIRSAIPLDDFDPQLVDRVAVRQSLDIPAEAPVLGNVGRFSTQKNPLDWVKIAGRVGRRLPQAWFLLVGDGSLHIQVEQALKDEGIFERTKLTGLRRDVPRMMSAMDIFLLTSLWEGLPRVIPEAMAMGIPVVAYQVDGIVEAVQPGETGRLCQPGDLDEMTSCCLELLQDASRRSRMAGRCRQFAISEFDLDHMVAQIADLYEEQLKKRVNARV